jgi:hypothetical protein
VVVNYANEKETADVIWPPGEGRPVEILKPFQPDTTENLPVKVKLTHLRVDCGDLTFDRKVSQENR